MEYGKFVIIGEDKKVLSNVKNTVASAGYFFLGYSKEPYNILRFLRSSNPDFLIVEVCNNFRELKPILEVIDEDLLAACILIIEGRNDDISEFIRNTRVFTYISKPVFEETLMQIIEISIMSFRRMLDYEDKLRKLNNTLESRKAVEKAKWILVEKDGLTETEAYEAIKKKSRDNRVPMRDIAEALILTRGHQRLKGSGLQLYPVIPQQHEDAWIEKFSFELMRYNGNDIEKITMIQNDILRIISNKTGILINVL